MSILTKLFRQHSPSNIQLTSKNVAKERLKLALSYDRSGLARDAIEQLRDEIIQLLAKHFTIRAEEIQISFDRSADCDKLIASIPLRTTQRPRMQVANTTAPKKTRPRRRRRPHAAN